MQPTSAHHISAHARHALRHAHAHYISSRGAGNQITLTRGWSAAADKRPTCSLYMYGGSIYAVMVTSEHCDQICGVCSLSQRNEMTYSPAGTWGTRTLSTTFHLKSCPSVSSRVQLFRPSFPSLLQSKGFTTWLQPKHDPTPKPPSSLPGRALSSPIGGNCVGGGGTPKPSSACTSPLCLTHGSRS